MSENVEQPPQLPSEETKGFVADAAKFFRKVSGKYMASTVAQSMAIAMMCQEENKNPTLLGQLLSQDTDKLSDLRIGANTAHAGGEARRGTGDRLKRWVKGGAKPPKEVSIERIKGIVEYDFEKAAELIHNHPDDLKEVLDLYPKRIKPGMPAHIVEEDYNMVKARLEELRVRREAEATESN